MQPTVSVILAVLNGEDYLEQALDSVLSQSFSDFELLVVDDGSTDRTTEILRRYAEAESRIRLLRHPRPQGLTASLNEGLALAQGEFIARIDHDDTWRPDKLAKQVARMRSQPSLGLLGTAYVDMDAKGQVISAVKSAGHEAPEVVRQHMVRGNPFFHSSVIFRREHGGQPWRYDEAFKAAQDYELWSRIMMVAPASILDEVLCARRIDGRNISVKSEGRQRRFAMLTKRRWIAANRLPWTCYRHVCKDLFIAWAPPTWVAWLRRLGVGTA